MLSKKAKYALKALLVLAREQGHGPILIGDLALREGIPKKFLEMILLELKNHGLLQSKKGKGGGYFLAKPAEQIFFGEVVRILDGPLAPIPCVSQMAYMTCEECQDEESCGVRLVMKQVRDAIAEILDGTSLADAAKRVERVRRRKHTA
ncbi:MAG: Rrf2 family transcriptional regulator [Planctomycetes bacterium]|nr:Rrf2 family transcriptional regulator [Planctomycetota bacterium]MBI3843218.1 Rrf2 family transcriptional regulator [Planctomycetota bacterium]